MKAISDRLLDLVYKASSGKEARTCIKMIGVCTREWTALSLGAKEARDKITSLTEHFTIYERYYTVPAENVEDIELLLSSFKDTSTRIFRIRISFEAQLRTFAGKKKELEAMLPTRPVLPRKIKLVA